MLRILDIMLSAIGLVLASPILIFVWLIGYADTGSPIFRQIRVGKHQQPFVLVKFRTMKTDTPELASHLAQASSVTSLGRLLRKTKLDELPQLWNVLKGDMSLVGPRPCLVSQREVIKEREMRSVFNFRPGITGLAQIDGIDMSSPRLLAETDQKMLTSLGIASYFKLILLTLSGRGSGDRIPSE